MVERYFLNTLRDEAEVRMECCIPFDKSSWVEPVRCGRKLLTDARACMLQVPSTRSAGPEGGESGHKTWGPPAFEARRHVRNLGLGLGSAAAAAARFRRRQPPAATELLYISDGDGNGVCRHLGTGYGRHSWVNPVLAGRVQARAASFLCLWQVNVIHM